MDPSEMTVKELKALVVGRGLEVPKKARKADLVEMLADEPAPGALWAVVDDECLDWVRMMSEHHSMPEDEVVRGMLYCAFNTMRSNGMVKSKAAVVGALADKGHAKRWIR